VKRILLAIGCDSYDDPRLPPLSGAEHDARNIHKALCGEGDLANPAYIGAFLFSPTLAEVQSALNQLASAASDADVLTIYFAGHGVFVSGSFYLCMRDSSATAFSASACSLSQLFLFVQEVAPKQANIIIDACQSGGVLNDIRNAFRAPDLGDAHTTGVGVLAACARNQFASEANGNGLFTTELLSCIRGALAVNENPSLHLSDIAHVIFTRPIPLQQAVFWGLNLSGLGDFCPNPRIVRKDPLAARLTITKMPAVSIEARRSLWQQYVELDTNWEPRIFSTIVTEVIEGADSNESRVQFVARILSEFGLRADECHDGSRPLEVAAACLCVLLPYCEDQKVEKFTVDECGKIALSAVRRLREASAALEEDEFALLGSSGIPEFFFLPLRISKLAAWGGFALHACPEAEKRSATEAVRKVFDVVTDEYALSCRALVESQAPFLLIALTGLIRAGLREAAASYFSLMFSTFIATGGRVLSYRATEEKIVPYLLAVSSGDFSVCGREIAQPSELGAVLILGSRLFETEQQVDEAIKSLDMQSIYAFVPDSYAEFNGNVMAGRNIVYQVGRDFFSVDELLDHWRPETSITHSQSLLSLLASIVFPDRVCWFLVPGKKRV
jgi:hypothetical protein